MDKSLFEIYKKSQEYTVWPLKEHKFISVISGTDSGDISNQTKVFTHSEVGVPEGFISAKIKDDKGVIVFLFVSPEFRLKGIGTSLLKQALEWFKANGVTEVSLGAKAGSYIFPGLPKNLAIEGFFKRNGFEISDEGLVDMYQDITKWEVSEDVFDRVESENVKIAFSNENVAKDIIEFAKDNFPNWYENYKSDMEKEKYSKVFYASIGDEIVGISKLWMGDCTWDLLFENNVGGGGALGVSDKHRGEGIGLAMKAWGTVKIKEKGIRFVWIGWTYAVDFYKKLGFKVWREYYKGKLTLK